WGCCTALRAIPVKPNGASERRYASCSTPLGLDTFSTKPSKVISSIFVAVPWRGETFGQLEGYHFSRPYGLPKVRRQYLSKKNLRCIAQAKVRDRVRQSARRTTRAAQHGDDYGTPFSQPNAANLRPRGVLKRALSTKRRERCARLSH